MPAAPCCRRRSPQGWRCPPCTVTRTMRQRGRLPPGPAGAKQYAGGAFKRFPDMHVTIEDMIAEDDRGVVRNHWMGIEAASGQRVEFSGIVIWRIAARQIHVRWAYLQKPHAAAG